MPTVTGSLMIQIGMEVKLSPYLCNIYFLLKVEYTNISFLVFYDIFLFGPLSWYTHQGKPIISLKDKYSIVLTHKRDKNLS